MENIDMQEQPQNRLMCCQSLNTFHRACGYRAAGSTCGISPSWNLQDNHIAAGCASHTQTPYRPAERARHSDWEDVFMTIIQENLREKKGRKSEKSGGEANFSQRAAFVHLL